MSKQNRNDLRAQGKAALNAPGVAPTQPPAPASTTAVTVPASSPVPALSGLAQRASDVLTTTRSILQEATELSQHTGPAPAGLGSKLREISDTLNRVEKHAEAAKKLLRLAADLSASRSQT